MHRPLILMQCDSMCEPWAVGTCACAVVFGSTGRNSTPSGGAVLVVQHTAQALAPPDHTCFSKMAWFWAEDPVG